MIDTPSLLNELQRRNIALTVEADKLSVNAPKGTMTPELAQEIRAHKAELLHLLGTAQPERQDIAPVVQYDKPPLICHKCLNTNPQDFKINVLRNRWVCCNCGNILRMVYPPMVLPEPAKPGAETEQLRQEVTEMIRAGHTYHESTEQGTERAPVIHSQDERITESLPVVNPSTQQKNARLKTAHAVLTDTSLVWCAITEQGRKIQTLLVTETPENIADVCNLANTHNLTHVWIMPGTALAEKATRDFVDVPGDTWDTFTSYTGDEEDAPETRFPMFSRIWRKHTSGQMGRTVKVGFPWRGDWEWIADSPVTLLATIDYLERTLGVPCEWSPGHMFIELVKHLNRTANRQAWVRETMIDLQDLPFNKSARDLVWKCDELPCTLDEILHLHEYDKHSAYLAACPGVNVGAGDPTHLTECKECDVKLPGIYRVTASPGASVFNGKTLPLLINTEWVTSDVLTYALDRGYEITVHECYQWQEKHRALESTATAIWNARQALKTDTVAYPHAQGRENAYNTMKTIALVGVGKFAYKKASHFLRPDWWASVVGKARSTMARKLQQLQEQGYTPVLIYADNVYFLSPDKNPETAIPGLTERAGKLGGFRCKSTLLVTPEIVEAFRTLSPGKLKELLNNLSESTEE